ncbi:uncharacterized protein LOC119165647 isoform X2 [Rhipicephalus microplus]|uniref:uncharacterized protein LOC119165647 isoform X2 n=1 Tax=Rhipicephalus microplus TaxID=6941 RepID=UPI00188992AE|nr:uncharacterized protein LOC119165647 isoform X1 [Rhipicephalus microplus]
MVSLLGETRMTVIYHPFRTYKIRRSALSLIAHDTPVQAIYSKTTKSYLFATEMACRLYSSCKPQGNNTRPEVLYHCIHVELRNASHFANLPRGDKIQQAAQNYMVCGEGVAKKYSISLQSLDDVMTVAYAAIHSFGWT